MEIKTKHSIDDEVWVLENVGDRMRPVKRRIYAIQIVATPGSIREEYHSPEGPLPETFPTVEVAEEALKVMEFFKKGVHDAMAKVRAGEMFSPEVYTSSAKPQILLDSNGNKLAK